MIISWMFHEEFRVTFYGPITEHNTSIVIATYPPIFLCIRRINVLCFLLIQRRRYTLPILKCIVLNIILKYLL